MMNRIWRGSFFLFLEAALFWGLAINSLTAQKPEASQKEEARDYFSKWLNEDVAYIIRDEEKDIFNQLRTPEEKERFIEQFWRRRDPDPLTAANEFKEEHYRRIAYANDHFDSGLPGWRSDRGRIYIIFGPPDSKDSQASGGAYDRPFHEGGGATATFPFEIWRYRHLEGIGDNVELEFVDKTWTGDFKLALSADEKDVFLRVPGHGNTLAEQIGMVNRTERLNLSPALRELYPMMQHRIKDSPFQRYETFARVKSAPIVKYKDLQESVRVDLSYDQLPFRAEAAFFKLGDDKILVPVTIEFSNRGLTYAEQSGQHVARIAVYGAVTSISNQVVYEFEDDIVSSYPSDAFPAGRDGRTLYQKTLLLERSLRYKLDLVAKDVQSGAIGTLQAGLAPPAFKEDGLSASSLVLADYIEQLAQIPTEGQMFVIGDFKVRPSVAKSFPADGVLGLYLQIYGARFDQASLAPSLETTYSILRDGVVMREAGDPAGESSIAYTDGRVVLIKGMSLQGIDPGRCRVQIRVKDWLRDEVVTLEEDFDILPNQSKTQE